MPADLDELFIALRAQADRVPGGTADDARQRGTRRRNRMRTLTTAALAAGLAVVGTAVYLLAPTRSSGLPAAPAYGAEAREAWSAIDGNAVDTAWLTADGQVGVLAARLDNGARLWRTTLPGRTGDLRGVIALPRAVLVIAGGTATVLDPATGRAGWTFPYRVSDDLVYYDDLLVRQERESGATRAYDWATGHVRWEHGADADPVERTVGMYVPSDARRAGRFGAPLTFTDRRLVQVTRSGAVRIRDAGTGEQAHTRAAAAVGGQRPIAYDGRLYTVDRRDPDAVRVTELTGPGGSRTVRTGAAVSGFAPCGDDRVCVVDGHHLTATTVSDGRQEWRVPAPAGAQVIQFLGAGLLVEGPGEKVLYDTAGKRLVAGDLGRADNGHVLLFPGAPGGEIVRIAVATGERRNAGPMPAGEFACTWGADKLACPGRSAVHLWSLR
jgi:putative pyrroloquinoline-quinone binding quinoprotein